MLIIVHDLLIEILLVFSSVLVDDIVENFWRHVLWSGHGELCQVSELERRAVIDQLDLFKFALLAFFEVDENVLSLEVRVHNFAFCAQNQSLAYLNDEGEEDIRVVCHREVEGLVVDLR